MKMAKRFIHLFVIGCTAISLISADSNTWSSYKSEFNRHYDFLEDIDRMETFQRNLIFIEKPKKLYETVANNFADQTEDELMTLYGFKEEYAKVENCRGKINRTRKSEKIPEYVNWVERGFVSPVGNQGKCGSDYAFSALGAVESRKAILENNAVTQMSVQQILDCSRSIGDVGCYGGYPTNIYLYMAEENIVYSSSDYPYVGISTKCQKSNGQGIRMELEDEACISIKAGDEEELREAVALYGPVSVAFRAPYSLFFYKTGIFNDPTCDEVEFNHSVLVVGYGTDKKNNTEYWLIKNSWGADWGENGYFKTLRNKDNRCGIASMATLPSFKKCS